MIRWNHNFPPQILRPPPDNNTRLTAVGLMPPAKIRRVFLKLPGGLLQRQRDFRQSPGLVADGRDMGTVVFPDAGLKIFLTASAEVRAERRYKQLKGKGMSANLPRLIEEIRERDERDSNRTTAPLRPAEDAILIDSSALSIDEVTGEILKAARGLFNDE